MLRRIMIPLDASPFTPAATQLAAQIANRIKPLAGRDVVRLYGLGLVDTDQLPTGRFASVVPREEILAEARAKAHELVEAFRKQALELGIAPEHVETHYTEGEPFVAIMHHHVFADMVIMGENCCFPPVNKDYDTMTQLYHRASRPIVLTPKSPREVQKVLMVMDGTAPSSRMLHEFAQLNPFPGARVHVVHSQHEAAYHNLKDFFERVEDYLNSYKFEVTQETVERHVLDVLPDLVRNEEVDAIAIGVHAEHFADRLYDPLHLLRPRVESLLETTDLAVFTVH